MGAVMRTRSRWPIAAPARRLASALALIAIVPLVPGDRPSSSVAAQLDDASRIEPGDSLRIRVRGALWMDASFEEWRADIMLLDVEGVDGLWPVSIFDLHGLEVYTERTSREGLRHGALLGAAGGLFLGAVIGVALDATGVIGSEDDAELQLVAHALNGAGIGTVVGGVAGAVYGGSHPGTGWVVLRLPGGGR